MYHLLLATMKVTIVLCIIIAIVFVAIILTFPIEHGHLWGHVSIPIMGAISAFVIHVIASTYI